MRRMFDYLEHSMSMKRPCSFNEESMILEKLNKRRKCENQSNEEESEDRLSDLPDAVLLHILSFLNTKHVVRTCVLSKRWEHLWKRIPTLMLYASRFSTVKQFAMFVSKILTLRDTSTALHALDLDRHGDIEPQLLKKILNYVSSHNTHLHELGITVNGDTSLIMSCVSSCRALTSLKLDVASRGRHNIGQTLFPKSLNLPTLTNLYLTNFDFCGDEDGCAEPFLAFPKLTTLVIRSCKVRDAQILRISSETVVNFKMRNYSEDFAKIELCAPSLCTFTFSGTPVQKICGSGLSAVKQVKIKADMFSRWDEPPMILFDWLLNLSNVKSLMVSSTTLRILSLVPDLLEVKLPSLCNLKSMEIKLETCTNQMALPNLVKEAMLKKAAAKSRKEAAKLRKAFKARLEPPPIPDGIVDFLRQNSPSAEVNIITNYPGCFNLKQVEESIKGAKVINYHSQLPASSAAPVHAAESASATVPASSSPPNLHLCCAEKKMRRGFITESSTADSTEKNIILERTKKRSLYANEVIEDRLSDLPDGVIIQILSLLDTKQVVRTCVLSKRWEHLWKRISTLILHSSRFSYVKQFTTFVSKILTLHDASTALLALDLDRNGNFEPRLLKRILNYISSHSTHLQELGISVRGDSSLILSCVSSCHALTSLNLSLHPRGLDDYTETLFPKSLNLPLLTSLDLRNFVFCGGESGCAEPFSAFTKLNSLVIRFCKLKDAQILTISSDTLANLAIHSPLGEINVDIHDNSSNMAKIELSTPSLYTFTYSGSLLQEICGSGLSSVKQVHIDDSREFSASVRHGLLVFNWLLDFANVESLALSSTTLQILSLVPDLLEVKLPSLCNLKSLEVELVPFFHRDGFLFRSIEDAMLKKAAAKSRKEVAKVRKAFKARLEPRAIPDGMVDFLRQNSPSAEVNITTDFSHVLNPKQVVESIKGAKIISYRSRFSARLRPVPFYASPASGTEYDSATALASVSVTASDVVPASAAPPNLHLCRAEKDDKSSNEDEAEKRQPNTDSPLLDNGQ